MLFEAFNFAYFGPILFSIPVLERRRAAILTDRSGKGATLFRVGLFFRAGSLEGGKADWIVSQFER
jgi:hypothetical protein